MAVFDQVTAFQRTTVRREIVNQWMNDSFLWYNITRDGRKKPTVEALDGGKVRFPLFKNKNNSMSWYGRGGTITSAPEAQIEAAEFEMKNCSITIYVDGVDVTRNAGSATKLKDALVKNAVDSAQDQFATEIYNDGSDTDKFVGIIGALTLSSYGGLTTAEVPDWAAKSYSGSTTMTRANLDRLWTDVRAFKAPPMGVTTPEVMSRIRTILSPQEQYTDAKTREAGFSNLVWNGITPIHDDPKCTGAGAWTGSHYLIFLNPDHIEMVWHPKRKMTPDTERIPEGKDARVYPYLSSLLVGMDMRKCHGYWPNIDPSAT